MTTKQNIGVSGVYYAAAEISKRNKIALVTIRNTEGYDLVVLNPSNNKSVGYQVKTSPSNEFIVFSSKAQIASQKITELKSDFIFVKLLDDKNLPNFYIVPVSEVKEILSKNLEDYSKKNPSWYDKSNMGVFKVQLEKIAKFKGNWELVDKKLQ